MEFTFLKSLKALFLLGVLLIFPVYSSPVNATLSTQISLLVYSDVALDDANRTLQEILSLHLMKPYAHPYLNDGMRAHAIWIRFTLNNPTAQTLRKTLVLGSPMLEHIAFYQGAEDPTPEFRGRAYPSEEHTTLFYHYPVALPAQTTQTYYLHVQSQYLPVAFALTLYDEKTYLAQDRMQLSIAIMIISVILALGLYHFILFARTRDRSYLYYSLYLFALILQQATYLGLTPLYLPPRFHDLELHIGNLQNSLIIFTSALFAMDFLKISKPSWLYTVYRTFLSLTLLQLVAAYLLEIRNLQAVALIAMGYIIFTLIAGILSYRQGNKQARFFIAGFVLLFISYMMMVLDALGLTTLLLEHRNLLAWATAIDALILSLAFADRYMILQQQKEESDRRILRELHNREQIIAAEVVQKTSQLKQEIQTKETLLQEVHHRVKNNLQIILSMIRLQNDETKSTSIREQLTDLEHRIGTIAKTYMMLVETDDLEQIDMAPYIETLLSDIADTYHPTRNAITIETDVQAIMPLKESVYVGLIINELVTNAYQHAFCDEGGSIQVTLEQAQHDFSLTIQDDGQGYFLEENRHSLGLKLIHSLVYDQLEGTLEQVSDRHTKNIIRFSV